MRIRRIALATATALLVAGCSGASGSDSSAQQAPAVAPTKNRDFLVPVTSWQKEDFGNGGGKFTRLYRLVEATSPSGGTYCLIQSESNSYQGGSSFTLLHNGGC
jgi:hypothetical protein